MSQRLRDHYDWVVVGDDIGALLSGALVARLGLSVLIVGPDASAHQKLSSTAQAWEPESNLLLGLGGSGLLTRCLGQLGLTQSEMDRFRGLDPALGLKTLTGTYVFQRSIQGFFCEIEREGGGRFFSWPTDEQLLEASNRTIEYWRLLPERLTLLEQKGASVKAVSSRSSLDRTLSPLGQVASRRIDLSAWSCSHPRPEVRGEFLDLTRAFAIGLGASPDMRVSDWWSLFSMLPTIGGFNGGISALRKLLVNVAIRNGAHCPERADLKRIFVSHGRLLGVQVAGHAQPVRVAGAILGSDFGDFSSLMDVSGRSIMGGPRDAFTPDGWWLSFSVKLPQRFCSESDPKRWFICEGGDDPLEMEWVTEQGNMMVRSRMPWRAESLSPETMVERMRRMRRRLLEEFPLAKEGEVSFFPDFMSGPRAVEKMREVFPYGELSQIPPNLRIHCKTEESEVTGVEGLFVSSNEVRAQLGSFGKIVSAIQTTAWIAHRSGVAGPFG